MDYSITFECSQIQNDMEVWDNILKNRKLIVEEIRQEKILLQNEYKEVKHPPLTVLPPQQTAEAPLLSKANFFSGKL